MGSLINSDLKAECSAYMNDLFDTFARNVTFIVYQNPVETIISLDSNFNSDWDEKKPWLDTNSSYTEVSETFPIRIWFLDYEQQVSSLFLEGKILEGPNVKRNIQRIKIQVKQDAFEFIKKANKCRVLDAFWNIKSSEKSVGIFDFEYYIFYLERAD